MPYATKSLGHGKVPSSRYVLGPEDVGADEVFISDAEFDIEGVFDENTKKLRKKTDADDADKKAVVDRLKASKNTEIQDMLTLLRNLGLIQ